MQGTISNRIDLNQSAGTGTRQGGGQARMELGGVKRRFMFFPFPPLCRA